MRLNSTQLCMHVFICGHPSTTHSSLPAQPTIHQTPRDETPNAGDTVVLPCRASSTTSPTTISYFWSRDGTRDNSLLASSSSGTLTLNNFQSSQNGLYECYVSITASGVDANPLVFLVGRAVVTVGGEGEMGQRGRGEGKGGGGGGTIHSPYLLLSSAHTEIKIGRI